MKKKTMRERIKERNHVIHESIGATHRPSKLYGCITRFQLYTNLYVRRPPNNMCTHTYFGLKFIFIFF